MKNGLISRGLDGFVRVSIGKSCFLKLPVAQYEAAIDAGKAERRAKQHADREAQGQATQEASRLDWITE